MLHALWSVLGPFVVGVLGWIAVNFAGKPLIEFLTLRKEIQQELILFSYIHPPHEDEEDFKDEYGKPYSEEAYNEAVKMYSDARVPIRRLGANLSALNISLRRPLSDYLHWRYKINDAAQGLLRLSTLFEYDDRIMTRHGIEGFLRLPYSQEREVQSIMSFRKEVEEGRAARRKATGDPPR